MEDSAKKYGLIALVALAVLGLVGFILIMMTSPQRTLNAFIAEVEAGNRKTALEFVGPNVKQSKMNNIEYFVDDWATADEITSLVVTDEAWRSRVRMTVDENGDEVERLNKHGFEDKEEKATTRYWSHHYQAYVNVEFDGFEDPVIIKLKRQTKNTWSPLAQIFRGWKVTNIKYQPLSDEDYEELDFDDLFDDIEFEDDDIEFDFNQGGVDDLIQLEDAAAEEDGLEEESTENAEETTDADIPENGLEEPAE